MLIKPCNPTPVHSLYLSNLDDQKFLRFSIKYVYLFKKSVNLETLKDSLSRVLVDYYPLAGRLKVSSENDQKLEVECNGEGALFAEAFMDITADEFSQAFHNPNRSWRKLLYKVDATTFLDIPPLVIQVRFYLKKFSNSKNQYIYIYIKNIPLKTQDRVFSVYILLVLLKTLYMFS